MTTASWDQSAMPYLWLFISYGGWQDAYTVVLEPCSNSPKDLLTAKHLRQAARLSPGGRFEAHVSVDLTAAPSTCVADGPTRADG